MECNKITELLSLYIDDELSPQDRELVDEHLNNCESCSKELEDLRQIRTLLAEPLVDLPSGFKQELHNKLVEANKEEEDHSVVSLNRFKSTKKKTIKRKGLAGRFNYKTAGVVAATFLVMVSSLLIYDGGLTGGLKNSDDSLQMNESAMPDEEPKMEMSEDNVEQLTDIPSESKFYGLSNMDTGKADGLIINGVIAKNESSIKSGSRSAVNKNLTIAESNRKIITNARVSIDTEEYDESVNKIIQFAESVGGYVESSNTNIRVYNRQNTEENLKEGNITIRVPSESFRVAYDNILELGVVKNQSVNTEDITLNYRETFDRTENLKVEEKRLRELISKADKIEDVLKIESQMTRLRGEIDALSGRLKRWDNLVSLATIDIHLNEVKAVNQITAIDDNILTKAKKGFIRSVNRLINFGERVFVDAIAFIPILLVWVFGLFIAYKIIMYIIKNFRRD